MFSESLRPLPGLNLAWLEAGILISAPVAGLRPMLALRFDTENVPNPTSRISSCFLSDEVMASKTASTASPACALVKFAASAMTPIRSFLFISVSSTVDARPRWQTKTAQPLVDFTRNARISGRFAPKHGAFVVNDPSIVAQLGPIQPKTAGFGGFSGVLRIPSINGSANR